MKKAVFGIGLFLWCMQVIAQQDYFVFIQDGSRQPFYARISDKTYSSSATGHLIIPSLKDSVYHIYIGFPKNQAPEQQFSIAVNNKDKGYELKNMGQGFELFDLQSLQFLKPAGKQTANAGISGALKKTDSYSRLMAGVVDDSAVLYTAAAKVAPAPEKEISVNRNAADPALKHKETVSAAAVAVKPPVTPPSVEYNAGAAINESKPVVPFPDKTIQGAKDSKPVSQKVKPDIVRFRSEVIATGKEFVYIDRTSVVPDTITLVIQRDGVVLPIIEEKPAAAETTVASTNTKAEPVVSMPEKDNSPKEEPVTPSAVNDNPIKNEPVIPLAVKEEAAKDTLQRIRASEPAVRSEPLMADTAVINAVPAQNTAAEPDRASVMNPDCLNFAKDIDVDKLRIRILSEKTDDEKALAAKNVFKTRCFTTRQIRALSELFTGDAGRYQLLDVAYPFVSDPGNFKELENLLKEAYYMNRFKAMLRH